MSRIFIEYAKRYISQCKPFVKWREKGVRQGKRGISNFIIHSIEVYFVSTAKITCFFAPAIRSPKDVGDKGINTFYLICSILLDISLRRERE